MLTADVDGIVALAETSSERGQCLECREQVVAKVGPVVIPHWAHLPDSTSDCPRKTGMGHWHETWQLRAYRHGCDIEKSILDGQHRADIVTPKGLVIELQSEPLDPIQATRREQFYAANTPHGMIWLIRLPESVKLGEHGYLDGPVHPRLGDLDARVYVHDTETDEIHSITCTTHMNEDTGRLRVSARGPSYWPATPLGLDPQGSGPDEFLRWARSWTSDHLPLEGRWRRGVWHSEGRRK